jgi:hypothetical protein
VYHYRVTGLSAGKLPREEPGRELSRDEAVAGGLPREGPGRVLSRGGLSPEGCHTKSRGVYYYRVAGLSAGKLPREGPGRELSREALRAGARAARSPRRDGLPRDGLSRVGYGVTGYRAEATA